MAEGSIFAFCSPHATAFTRLFRGGVHSTIPPLNMKRFGIFKKLEDGGREFVGISDDETSATTEAMLRKEHTGRDYMVFSLKTKRKKFDTGLYDRHLKKWNDMKSRKVARKSG
jgi:hypothetical protein